jgi:hypothetical protein
MLFALIPGIFSDLNNSNSNWKNNWIQKHAGKVRKVSIYCKLAVHN